MEDSALAPYLRKALKENDLIDSFDENYILKSCNLIKGKISLTTETWDYGRYLFVDPIVYDEQVIKKRWNEKTPQVLKDLIELFSNLESFTRDAIEAAYQNALVRNEISGKDFLQLFRVCLTGVAGGPPLFEIAELLGKEKTNHRLTKAINISKP